MAAQCERAAKYEHMGPLGSAVGCRFGGELETVNDFGDQSATDSGAQRETQMKSFVLPLLLSKAGSDFKKRV